MTHRSYLIVGHGGQGILDLANFIAYDSILRGLHVAYTPSYGPETRGGKVRCYVVKSAQDIDSPVVDEPDVLVAMNNPSMDFEPVVKAKGLILLNSSLIDRQPGRTDLHVVKIPATTIADELRNAEVDLADTRVLQNSVAYGGLLAVEGETLDKKSTLSVLEHVYTGSKSRFIPANLRAIESGYDYMCTELKPVA